MSNAAVLPCVDFTQGLGGHECRINGKVFATMTTREIVHSATGESILELGLELKNIHESQTAPLSRYELIAAVLVTAFKNPNRIVGLARTVIEIVMIVEDSPIAMGFSELPFLLAYAGNVKIDPGTPWADGTVRYSVRITPRKAATGQAVPPLHPRG